MTNPAHGSPATRRVLVTGCAGFVGGRLAARLLEQGVVVRSLDRSAWSGPPHVEESERHRGLLPDSIPAACVEGVDAVVHCAALTGRGSDAEARRVNVEGSLALAGLARAAGVRRFVFVSSQSARADAEAAYGRTKHEAERALLALSGIDVVVVRPGLVIGPGGRGLFARMRRIVRLAPLIPVLGGGMALVQPIHVDDLAEALARCAEGAAPAGSVLHLGDPEGVTLRDLLRRTCVAETGRAKPMLSVPVGPFLAVARIAEALRLPLPVTSASLRALRRVDRMDSAPDLRRLGLTLRPLDEALAGILA